VLVRGSGDPTSLEIYSSYTGDGEEVKAVEAVVGDKCMMLIECFDGIATERSSFS
jgi:hypothetical protein